MKNWAARESLGWPHGTRQQILLMRPWESVGYSSPVLEIQAGEGFSFVKIPASGPLTETTAAARIKMSNEEIAYRTEIAKIWKAQLKALSDSTPPPDEGPANNQTDPSVASPANTP